MFGVHTLCLAAVVLGGALLLTAQAAGDQVLYDFGAGFDVSKLPARDVTLSLTDAGALRIACGHQQDWPGVDLPAPQGHWDLTPFANVLLEVKNAGATEITVNCRVDNPGADGMKSCVTDRVTLGPGKSGTLSVFMTRREAGSPVKLFGMRGYPAGLGGEQPGLDCANITNLVVFVANPQENYLFEMSNVRAAGEHVAPPPPVKPEQVFPLIDTFGQYTHRDWPGKVHSLAELQGRIGEEDNDLAAHPGPANWDRWGGWQDGPTLAATGFFYPAKHEGKWWLVDPDGKLFFSQGIDCVRMMDATPITERERWFADFPGDQPEFQQFLSRRVFVLHGHYAGKSPDAFSFAGANLKRKYGEGWHEAALARAHSRLRSWGLNTVGNWSDWGMFQGKRTPYVVATGFRARDIEGSAGYWGKFKDPFDPAFSVNARREMARQVGVSANDPWCLGYFVDNESSWGDETSLSLAALQSPADQPAKAAFLGDLKARYDTVEALNAAWGTHYASWDALVQSREAPPDLKRARDDLRAFYTRIAEEYFKVCRDAVKSAAPHNLYLGCRFAWVNDLAAEAAAKFCDVVSYNLYRHSVADFRFPGKTDVPLIIGEFHFGALDRGMFHTGLVPVASQQERAKAYTAYVEGALRNPQILGCHWFQYQDEPTTGRTYDEENYQIGFVDIADTPYAETVAAARDLGRRMYEVRRGGK